MGRQITYRRMTEPTSDQDGDAGRRVLVDRLWPEGLRRQAAPLDEWLSDIAPSRELQDWYNRHPLQFDGIRRHVLRRIPLRYEIGWWNLVFPIGLYAATTHELGRATGTSWMTVTGRWEIWLAAVVWAMVVAAMAAARFPPRDEWPGVRHRSSTAVGVPVIRPRALGAKPRAPVVVSRRGGRPHWRNTPVLTGPHGVRRLDVRQQPLT
ncbi:DUF488 family protein [Streptomyces sp. NPDC059766]|uniref:DUF488 domain-containing protein n=1 Tax=Streptomyces sp. NPDC059766 TaxID=3346940 RepID=UPI003651A115